MRINLDGPILRTLSLIFDVTIATLLFLLCCLPVFTVGASAAAMQSTMIVLAGDGCTSVTRHFFGAFRDNFKQATGLWLPVALVGAVVAADIAVCWGFQQEPTMFLSVLRGLTVFCTCLYVSMSIYLFAGIAVYQVTGKQALSNALFWTMKKLPGTLGLLLIYGVMAASIAVLWFFAFPVVGLCLYLQAKLLRQIFNLQASKAHHEEEILYE